MRNGRISTRVRRCLAAGAVSLCLAPVHASPQTPPSSVPGAPATPSPVAPVVPSDYVIGLEDVLSVTFWRDKEVSADVVVRPDGKISLLLINDVQAAGLTVEQLRLNLTEARRKFEEDPTVSVIVRQINSRKVFITGSVAKPGAYPLLDTMTVIQLISKAGGLAEYADKKNIIVWRENPGGSATQFKVNYNDFFNPKKSKQNIVLKPGDTVIIK